VKYSAAERILRSLGIESPEEIDLEAVAWSIGAKVKYRQLKSCEARICGCGDRAIISIDSEKIPQRRRFSLAHEIAHWIYHRGQLLICRSSDIGSFGGFRRGVTNPEFIADQFGSELVLPSYILLPILKQFKALNLRTVEDVSTAFRASKTATAIRLLQSNRFEAMIVCHGEKGRRWFLRPPCVPDRWFPQDSLDRDSYAFDTLFGSKVEQIHPRKIGADAWFDHPEAARYELLEHSFPLPNSEVLTLLTFTDGEMMEERDSSWSFRRS
jgi:Zn-dependent peptidase ImmA (M78 family)